MSKGTKGRVLVGTGAAVLLWGVLGFTSASLGGPPDEISFANRRPYNEVKRAAHSAFLPLVLRTGAGLMILLFGAKLAADVGDKPEA